MAIFSSFLCGTRLNTWGGRANDAVDGEGAKTIEIIAFFSVLMVLSIYSQQWRRALN